MRNDSPYGDALVFEPQTERSSTGVKRYEMVVTDKWTSKVRRDLISLLVVGDYRQLIYAQTKTNRDDGSYATGDLYERHPTKENVWRYVGRGDDVIVMVSRFELG